MIRLNSTISHLTLFFLFCCLCQPISAAEKVSTTDNAQASGKAIWAWSDKSGSEHAIYISRQAGDSWEKPQKVSANEGVNVVPAVVNPSGNDLMVVWSNYAGSEAQLHYRQLQGGQWSEEKKYYTGLTSNLAPSVSVDGNGKIWLVWVGFNGISDEIYFATWNGTSFTPAQAITANDVPDIQPVLGIDEATGTPWVQWLQYSPKGYVKYESSWSNSAWSEPVLVTPAASSTAGTNSSTNLKTVVMKKATDASKKSTSTENPSANADVPKQLNKQVEIEIPDFIATPQSASIHIPGYAVHSLPVRSVAKEKEN
jgi:hypothetical protein